MIIYDYIIIGAGISGSICAIELAKNNQLCLLIEKEPKYSEKICGGGIPYKALMMLHQIGLPIDKLSELNIKKIKGHIINNKYGKVYELNQEAIGMQRSLFDSFLQDEATLRGAHIVYNEPAVSVQKKQNHYLINTKYYGKKLIWATGARKLNGAIPNGQSIGVSAQIYADSLLEDSLFHYWYFAENRYFWAFPIGDKLWNVGVWSSDFYSNIKKDYEKYLEIFFSSKVVDNWFYVRKPKGEFLGHYDQRDGDIYKYGVGDFAGMCNPKNGGGIIYAIKSALNLIDLLNNE